MAQDVLFSRLDLRAAMEHREREMMEKIDKYAANQLLNSSMEDLVDYFVKTHEIPPIKIHDDKIYAEIGRAHV